MAFTTLQSVLTALPGQPLEFVKATPGATASGGFTSFWTGGGYPPAGATPSSGLTGDVPTSATPGAWPFVNPVTGSSSYLARIDAEGIGASATGVLFIYDRLWQDSGLSVTSTSAQTVNSIA